MCPFVIGIFHLACFQGSSMLQQVSVPHSFLRLNNIDLYGYTTLCLFIHQINIWIVSTFWPL